MSDLFSAQTPPDHIEQDGVKYWREDLVTLKRKADASGFDKFWENVPGGPGGFKIGKEASRKVFAKLKADDKHSAINAVGPFYAHWRKEHPDAAKLHPERFLKYRRWEDEGWNQTATQQPSKQDLMDRDARDIKSGKSFICGHITAAKARTLIESGRVTLNECREVGISI